MPTTGSALALVPELYRVRDAAIVLGISERMAYTRTGDVTIHTLRHTAITRMVSDGIDDFTVMELVGHLTRRMLERYTHPPTTQTAGARELRSPARRCDDRR